MIRVLTICLLLAGCTQHSGHDVRRADGRKLTGPALQQAELDGTYCKGEAEKIFATSNEGTERRQQSYSAVLKGCMASKGYILTPY
jgi:hypothetical protein